MYVRVDILEGRGCLALVVHGRVECEALVEDLDELVGSRCQQRSRRCEGGTRTLSLISETTGKDVKHARASCGDTHVLFAIAAHGSFESAFIGGIRAP